MNLNMGTDVSQYKPLIMPDTVSDSQDFASNILWFQNTHSGISECTRTIEKWNSCFAN